MQKSEGANAEGGVAVDEREGCVGIGELAAAEEVVEEEEAIAVGEVGVVLDGALFRCRREHSGGVGPFLDGVGEAVVHLEGEDAACIAGAQREEDEKEEEEDEEEFRGMERRHVSLLLFAFR